VGNYSIENSGEKNSDWGFGQVIAISPLIAPLIIIIDHFEYGNPYTFNF